MILAIIQFDTSNGFFFLLWYKYKISGFITILPNIVYACLFACLSIVKHSSQGLTICLLRKLKGKKTPEKWKEMENQKRSILEY